MQKLAIMMAVMLLGMPPVNGYHIDRGVLVAEKEVNPAVSCKGLPAEPGGQSALRILQQLQLGMESLSKVKVEIQRREPETEKTSGREEWNPGSGGSGHEGRPKREAAQKVMDALKKGADATPGRGRRKGRMYQRTGIRN